MKALPRYRVVKLETRRWKWRVVFTRNGYEYLSLQAACEDKAKHERMDQNDLVREKGDWRMVSCSCSKEKE